ncbi:hypothetical protein EV424DRAFT_431548 [Suillus variegatus]|nr:hypothetical protein EV424DRAFT_431548 [Suillus variegatus]
MTNMSLAILIATSFTFGLCLAGLAILRTLPNLPSSRVCTIVSVDVGRICLYMGLFASRKALASGSSNCWLYPRRLRFHETKASLGFPIQVEGMVEENANH